MIFEKLGQDDKILDVQHYRWENGFCIYVFYENRQLVKYQFSNYENLENYEIIHHTSIENHKYYGFCPLENNIIFYSDNEMFFESNPEKSFQVLENGQLLKITPSFILVEHNQYTKLIMHSFKYQEINTIILMPNEKNMLYVLDKGGYFYVNEDCLYFQQNKKRHFITHLGSEFECFAAIRIIESSGLKIYIKYSDYIQIMYYSFEKKELSLLKLEKLPKYLVFTQMKIVKDDLLYAISEQMVYLINFSVEDIKLYKLDISVKCKNLILQNLDTTDRVQGEQEYTLLKKASDFYENKNEDRKNVRI